MLVAKSILNITPKAKNNAKMTTRKRRISVTTFEKVAPTVHMTGMFLLYLRTRNMAKKSVLPVSILSIS